MKIDKISGQYNTYKLELSWGQMLAVISALERDHADPVSDELYEELCWYKDHLPGPGEEKEDIKARDEATDLKAEGDKASDADDYPLPMPPGHDKAAKAGADSAPDSEGSGPDSGPDIGPELGPDTPPSPQPHVPGDESADEDLPPPPSE